MRVNILTIKISNYEYQVYQSCQLLPSLNISERVIVEQLQSLLGVTSALDTFQSSFCSGLRTEIVLVTLTEALCKQLNQGTVSF